MPLSSVEDDAIGEELRADCELERRAVIHEHASLQQPSGFADPAHLAPFPAGIAVEEYRLNPAVRALPMPRINLPSAEDLVLGRTIKPVLVAQKLILRHRVTSIRIARTFSIKIPWCNQKRDKLEQQGTTLLRQIPNLRRTRDLLLPRLLSEHLPVHSDDRLIVK